MHVLWGLDPWYVVFESFTVKYQLVSIEISEAWGRAKGAKTFSDFLEI